MNFGFKIINNILMLPKFIKPGFKCVKCIRQDNMVHVLSKMQLVCETLFPPRMSVTITFLTYSSYTSQSIAVVTTAPIYLFIDVT